MAALDSDALSSFCGSAFWDLNQTWYTDNPDFTHCFHQTVLVWIPCGILWLLAPFATYDLLYSAARNIPWTGFSISKIILNLLLIVLEVVDLGYAIHRNNQADPVYAVSFVTPALVIVTLVLAMGLLLAGRQRGIQSSGPLFLFWFMLTVCGAFTYRSRIMDAIEGLNDETTYAFVWYMIYYPLVVAMLFVNCFADAEPQYLEGESKPENPSPEEGASFLSRMVYQWFDVMAWRGYKRPLEMKDLWDLNRADKSAQVVPEFEKEWQKLLQKRINVAESTASFAPKNSTVEFKPSPSKAKKLTSVLPALAKTFGPTFLFGSLLKLVQDLLAFVSPQILRLLIAYVNVGEESWKGYVYAVILTVTAVVQTIFLGQYFQRMFVVGMRIRTALVSAIYRKALLISNSARKESTVGEIVNLMSVDAQRLMDLTTYLNMLWSAPLQIGLAMYFLYDILGPSVFTGLGVMILLIPVNGVLANMTKKLQMQQMKNKDKRVKLMNEILNGIKVLKLYAWEPSFQSQVESIRETEIEVLKKSAYLSAGTSFIWACAPFLVSLLTFMTYVLSSPDHILNAEKAFVSLTLFNIMRMPMSILPVMIVTVIQVTLATFATYVTVDEANVLNAEKAFVALALFNLLRFPMSMFPMLVVAFVQAKVSIKRINKFMNADELDPESISHDTAASDPVILDRATFCWSKDETPVLKEISFNVKQGQLVAVVGQVGAGKSSLISALLGEMEKVSGRVNTKGRIAYVPQQAWIQNCSLKDNILFGNGYDESKYKKVVEGCALKADLDMLPAGDSTEIGEKGINLSGGQKQRVSLARAVYCDMDLYFLDDPLSAVDSHVGKHIFENIIGPGGLLKSKTRILVTHGITYLPQVDTIVVLKDGQISEIGSYKELLAMKGDFAEFLLQHLDEESGEAEDEITEIKQQLESTMGKDEFQRQISRQRSQVSESMSQHSEGEEKRGTISPERTISRSSSTNSLERSGSLKRRTSKSKSPESEPRPVLEKPKTDKLIEAEKAETGKVKMEIYGHYLRSVGGWLSFWTLLLYGIFQAFSMLSNIWLSKWSNDSEENQNQNRDLYLGVYGGLGVGQAVSVMVASVLLSLCTLRASQVLHMELLRSILRLPMAFFDTTPVGRLLNRFGKEVDALDNTLPFILRGWITTMLQVLATVVIISYSTPIFLVVVIPIGVIYYWIQHVYVASSRQLKRLESVSRSPIYSHFGETITGASVIRAYGAQLRFIHESEARVDTNQICYYPSIIANRWLSVRLETVGNLIVLFAALFAVIGRDTLSAGLVGLSISYALNITQTLNWFMRMTSEVETNIVAVERIKEYCQLEQEASWEKSKAEPPRDWPENGNVSFQNYQVRYREGLDLVLKGINCDIKGGEKVGIVGRTGAGKSSLTLGLFRIIEAAGGAIVIDGINIADLGLHVLRSRLTIIPQDPVLFSGTLRINLDPFTKYSDEELWRALEHAHLKSFVKSLPAGLEHEVTEGGENLSVGQRQLICLARALLRKTKVLILDEATAAVDLETDDLIQATIRSEFKECTVITIAHRLNTIMDSTRVLVLDKGEIREFDSPSNLLADKKTIFYGMARDAGLV